MTPQIGNRQKHVVSDCRQSMES